MNVHLCTQADFFHLYETILVVRQYGFMSNMIDQNVFSMSCCTGETLKSLRSVGLYQALTHAAGVIALGAGAVSFTQVVKASEPAFTAAISAFFFSEYLPWQCYAALVPVMIGVSMASVTELTFSWFCLGAGMMANVFAAARGYFTFSMLLFVGQSSN